MPDPALVFDGHSDILLRLSEKLTSAPETSFLEGDGEGHIDLPRAVKGRMGGGILAIFSPSRMANGDTYVISAEDGAPPPPEVTFEEAVQTTLKQMAILFRIERASEGRLRICRTAEDIRQSLSAGTFAAVLHCEGAEQIDHEFRSLELFYQAGLRSLGPVWSRPNLFGHGAPFAFPGTPDTGPGLTSNGKALVTACQQLGIAIDLSHLNEKGFWDVAALSDTPLIATHSNVHALCPSPRNLTDRQLAAIRDSGGMVGLNFATCFIRPDGKIDTDTSLDLMLHHLDYLIEHLGVDHVGFGSDFDGAAVPKDIGDASGLPNLIAALRARGFGDDLLAKFCHENWIRVLDATWR
jgi:membrane dipeptidase